MAAHTTRDGARTVRCPSCGGPSPYEPENRYRPFCSARCKLHDLGDWASERFRLDASGDDETGTDPWSAPPGFDR